MALNTNKTLKKYYSIREVADMFGLAESNLRFWEKEFPTIKPKKSGRNVRQYTAEDIEEVRLVYNLVKERGLKLSAARELLSKNRQAATDTAEILARLQSVRDELLAINNELKALV
ncbi:MAG: MerR family transcriptional regulator [Bacteroidaceae bacterium]|nr:MerR family transcriptional regulator [Bacteroidaceae bacterium]